MNVLWVGAHPDDMELLAGGTLAKYAKKGHRVYSCIVSKAEKGGIGADPDELVRTRLRETEEACEVLGAQFVGNLGWPDMGVFITAELINAIVEVIRQTKPDLVITHSPNDYQIDHINTGIATVYAVFIASDPAVISKRPFHRVSRTLYCDTIFGLDFEPDFWIDISDTIDIKLKALSAHKSQLSYLTEATRVTDVVEDCRTCARYRGLQSGVQFAEAFKLVRKQMQNLAFDLAPPW